MNGKIYKIIYKPTNKICYVGKTHRELRERFLAHCDKAVNTAIHNLIIEYGRENFTIEVIQDGIQSEEELKLLEKKYIREYSQKYQLYNKVLYTTTEDQYKDITEDTEYKDDNPVVCIETGEVFKNKFLACKKYNLTYHQMWHALKYGYSAGFNENDINLHWRYEDDEIQNKNYVPLKYKVYIVKQLINNVWTPIYVGRTCRPLSSRLAQHKAHSSVIHDILNKYPENQFRIEAYYDNIEDKEKAAQLEYELTMQYMENYFLYNKNIGDCPNYITKGIDKRLYKVKVKDVLNNKYFNIEECNECCQCVETGDIFFTYEAASFQFHCHNYHIKEAIETGRLLHNIHIKSVDITWLSADSNIYMNPYSIISIFNSSTKQVYKFYNTRISGNDILSYICASRDLLIKQIIEQIGKENIGVSVIYSNIIFKREAEQLCNEEENKYNQKLIKMDKKQLQKLSRKKVIKKKEKVIKRELASIAAKNAWQDETKRKNRLDKLASKRKAVCINTGQVFNSIKEASEYFNVHTATISRVCQGQQNGFKDKNTGEQIYMRYKDSDVPKVKENKLFALYYVLCDNKIKAVIVSKQDENAILPYQKCNRNAPLYKYIQEYGYEHFSIQKQIINIKDKTEAMKLKKEHILKLMADGNQLYTTHL